jgi:hypothetical protein
MSDDRRQNWRKVPTRYGATLCQDGGGRIKSIRLDPKELRVVTVPAAAPKYEDSSDSPDASFEYVVEIALRVVDVDGRLISFSTVFRGFGPEPAA